MTSERQRRTDDRALNDAIRHHGRFAHGRLRTLRRWAEEDARAADEAGDRTRAAMRRAAGERLGRIIRELERTGRGGAHAGGNS